jgi:hypothetical protein
VRGSRVSKIPDVLAIPIFREEGCAITKRHVGKPFHGRLVDVVAAISGIDTLMGAFIADITDLKTNRGRELLLHGKVPGVHFGNFRL